MTVRVYVPSSLSLLRDVVVSGGVGPVPILAHAVTDALREAYAEGGEEEWEYAAMSAAAQDSLALLTEDEPQRRVVIVLDADTVFPVEVSDVTLVEIPEVLPARLVAAVHVDAPDAEEAVAAARGAWAAADAGDADAARVVERCLDHELGWFAAQEVNDLIESLVPVDE